MKRILYALGVVAVLAAIAFAVVWFVPSVQDAIIKRGMVAGLNKANSQLFLKDKALHNCCAARARRCRTSPGGMPASR